MSHPAVPARWESAVTSRTPSSAAPRRVSGWVVRAAVRSFMAAYAATLRSARRRPCSPPISVLVTLTTHSDAWARSHLGPLARSAACASVTAVVSRPLAPIAGVTVICPPRWLMRILGDVPARLLTFAWVALSARPDLVGGFHLQMNGLAATWLARLTRARSAYFCVGGPREVIDGGVWSENRIFGRLPGPDQTIERRLLAAVEETDLVITMGSSAAAYFGERGLQGRCHVVPGGIDTASFRPGTAAPDLDIVFVGRLVPIKRVDLLLRAVQRVAEAVPGLRTAIVGDGPLRDELQALSSHLGLDRHVIFAGRQENVADWLRRAKILMLTSESEGLALSLMEAMCCGVAPVVADVGDLGDLVTDGETGYLVADRTPEAFASQAIALLQDPARLARVRNAASRAAVQYTVDATTERWDRLFSALGNGARR